MTAQPALSSISLPALIAERARERPDAVFLEDSVTDEAWTNARLDEEAGRWARRLAGLGVHPEATVATMLPNCLQAVAVWLGIARLGAIEVPGNLAYRGPFLDHYLRNSGAKVAIVDPTVAEQVARAEGGGALETIVVIGEPPAGVGRRIVASDSLVEASVDEPARIPEVDEIATIMYTSGTTGDSKGVLVSWSQIHESALGWMPVGGTEPDGSSHTDIYRRQNEAYYSPFPFHHMAARAPIHMMALLGGRIVMRTSFKTQAFWTDVREHRCTSTELLGTMALFLHRQPPQPDDADNPLRFVLMVPVVQELDDFCSRFGVRTYTCYNMTELSIPLVSAGFELANLRSCGRVRDGYACRIVDKHDRPVPTGEVGELIVRAEEPGALMSGYWRLPEATVAAWRNLWFHTGDGFRQDEDGNFYFVDRLKDTIRRRGENISSIELERVINSHPAVLESAAVGVPSEYGEEEVKIVVVLREDARVTEAELLAEVTGSMPEYMLPRYVEIVEILPKTPTEKVRKAPLRENWNNERTWDRRASEGRVST